MKKNWLLITLLTCGVLLTWCFNKVEKSADTIMFEQLKETFTWNIVDWTNSEIVEITWDYTLYYNDEFGIATVLWEEWKWYSVRVDRINDDFEYSWEVVQIPRSMLRIWKFISEGNPDFYSDDYWFNIISNENVEKIKTKPDVWNISYGQYYKWQNNNYNFFEASLSRHWNQRYLPVVFPSLDCRTWTGWIEYDIDWNPHEYLDADCNWYEIIDWETVKTRKSWIEQLFPYWFIFYDIN